MDTLKTILAFLGRAWTAVWTKAKAIGNTVVDPPPRTVKVYFFACIAVFLALMIVGNVGWRWASNRLAVMVGLASDTLPATAKVLPLAAIPKLPDIITIVPPPAPVAPVEVKTEKPDEKIIVVKAPEAKKMAKRKAKKKAPVATDPWNF